MKYNDCKEMEMEMEIEMEMVGQLAQRPELLQVKQ